MPVNSSAATNSVYFEDGSYLTIIVEQVESRAAGTVTGNKTYTYAASDGDVKWKAVLHGTFSYTGSAASCTSSSCDVTIYNSSWYVVSKTASKSGATATADVTVGFKFLGITTEKIPISIRLKCDANGNLS